jgi:hypothetical protein
LEHDVTGAQRIGFKIFKKLKMEENDRIKLNLIPKGAWEKHYAEIWEIETTTEENRRSRRRRNRREHRRSQPKELETVITKQRTERAQDWITYQWNYLNMGGI